MQGTMDRSYELTTTAEPCGASRRRTAVRAALVLALLVGSATAGAIAADLDGGQQRGATARGPREPQPQDAQQPQAQDGQEPQAPTGGTGSGLGTATGGTSGSAAGDGADAPPVAPAGDAGTADTVPAGTYGVRVLAQGWDRRGRYVAVDRGRLTDGPAAEPGVDGTRPVVLDTGAVAERRRIDLADGHVLRFARSGGAPSYGSGSWADLVTELSGRATAMLATVQVDGDGRLVSLEEPYRP